MVLSVPGCAPLVLRLSDREEGKVESCLKVIHVAGMQMRFFLSDSPACCTYGFSEAIFARISFAW